MNYHSRGISRRRCKNNPPPPLTDMQKTVIESWSRRGRRDREIAQHLDLNEYRVTAYRLLLGINCAGNRGGHQIDYQSRALRPGHVEGEAGSDEWFASCDRMFTRHVIGVLATGGW